MKNKRRIVTVLVSVALLDIVGCRRSNAPNPTAQAQLSLAGLDLVHDFGSVIEGSKVEHAFETVNNLSASIAVADDSDIQKTCGCTTLDASKKRLEPGEKATIRMRVDTTGKSGRIRVGGVIRWHSDDGQSWPINLYLEGTAKTILAAQPGLVQFSPAEVAERKIKELLVFNSLDVDWSTLCVRIEPPYAELVETVAQADRVKLLLRPHPPSEAIDFSATVRLSVTPAVVDGGTKTYSISVPVQGSQSIDVQVSPRVVFASWSWDERKGSARFLVRGMTTDMHSSIASISCDGFRTAWVSKDVPSLKMTECRTLQVELNLSEPSEPSFDATQARCVRIAFKSGRSIEVPVYFVARSERS